MSPSFPVPSLAIVGLGPRGISVLERLAAALAPGARGTLHLIDDAQHGAGRVWDTTQTRTLCMNTLSAAVTLFTEPGASVSAPVLEGPTLHEWIEFLRGGPVREEAAALLREHPPAPEVAEAFAAEMAATRPESHPSRALYGAYLRWVHDVAVARLPESVDVVRHHSRVVDLQEEGDKDRLRLADGTELRADATVLSLGWQVPGPTEEESVLAEAGHTWIRPDNPLDQDLSAVPESGTVLVRGLGMGFFDVMALLTIDRGGRFLEDPGTRSGLRYVPSGREPHLVVTSRRGYPYLPKSDYGGLPPAAARPRLKALCAARTDSRRIDFGVEVWPAIVADAHEAYLRTLARVRPTALRRPLGELVELLTGDPEADEALIGQYTEEPFSLTAAMDPLAGVHGTRAEVSDLIARNLARDIREAALGADSPVKAALWSVSASRKPAAILGARDRYTLESRTGAFSAMTSLGQMVGSGPPLFRTRQLLALVDAGLVSFLGAAPRLRVDADGFHLSSPTTGGEEVSGTVLVDAWMHRPDIRRPGDPLARALVESGRARPFRLTRADGSGVDSGSPEVDPRTRLLIGEDGPDPRVMLLGIPTWAQMPDTTISPLPGTDALLLQETDAAVRTLLAVADLDAGAHGHVGDLGGGPGVDDGA